MSSEPFKKIWEMNRIEAEEEEKAQETVGRIIVGGCLLGIVPGLVALLEYKPITQFLTNRGINQRVKELSQLQGRKS